MKMTMKEVDFKSLQVDKENEIVSYNDEIHAYWTKDTEQRCISVTTLIHRYTTFDEEFWAAYKALESLLSVDDFLKVKPRLLDTKKFTVEYLEQFKISDKDFLERKNEILAEWAEKRETSCIRGTAIHREQELLALAGKSPEIQKLGLGGNFKTTTTNKIESGQAVYPELLLSRISEDGKLRLAGQADLIIVDGWDVYVLDFKTNKKIDLKSFYDRKLKKSQKLKYPLNHVDDANFWHYTLQLSTYAWMIQKIDPRFNIKLLQLIHFDHDGNLTEYECEYRKQDVERMLVHYKKEIEYEEFKKSREKINF